MNSCDYCGKKFLPKKGHSNQLYCGGTCKTAAYRSRQRQKKATKLQTLGSAHLKDLSYIRERSEDAYKALMTIKSLYGRECFEDALNAVYSAVIDMVAAQTN